MPILDLGVHGIVYNDERSGSISVIEKSSQHCTHNLHKNVDAQSHACCSLEYKITILCTFALGT